MIGVAVTEAELGAWGRRVGAEVQPPVFIGLRGPLGAGKSLLARAVAEGAGVREYLPSPTFNIVFRYELAGGRRARGAPGGATADGAWGNLAMAGVRADSVVHADLYRLGSVEELGGIGWDDLVGDEGAIVLVEWPERAGGELPADRWEVTLGHVAEDPGLRTLTVARHGEPSSLPAFVAGVA